MTNPACRALENTCKKIKITAAAIVAKARKALTASKAKLEDAEENLDVVLANVPPECKKGDE